MHGNNHSRSDQGGFILLLTMVAMLIPLFLIIGATTSTMMSRQSRLRSETEDERSFAAAESGIDYCVYRANAGLGLVTGTTYARDLGNGLSFSVATTFLRTDGLDNDSDGTVDESDEDAYRLISSGTYRANTRRVVAYLGPSPLLGSAPGALSVRSTNQLQLDESAFLSGIDRNIDGTPGPGPNVPGVSVEPPTTVATALGWADAGDYGDLRGNSPSPSVAQGPDIDFPSLRTAIQNSANIVLTSQSYKDFDFGNATSNNFTIIYAGSKVQFQGTCRGAGILFINGDLQAQENFRFDGIVFVTGKVQMQGTATICGALFCDVNDQIQLQVSAKIQYSSEAIAKASAILVGKYVIFNGWQEISRK